ncbi:MAG TPA: hypothetical protein VH599_12450 [Ktedonobacterales bacterium]|jgi:hypothetical protein
MSTIEFISNFFLAAVPGVLIALFVHQLEVRRYNQLEERANQNARKLLSLEIQSNRASLASFWQEINDLDTEKAEITSDEHLTAITEGGFLTYPLPHWNFTRWQPAQPSWLVIVSEKEVELVDRIYRNLELITDLHTRMVTLSPQEQELMAHDRFWASRYASMRNRLFPRLVEVVNQTLAARNPL